MNGLRMHNNEFEQQVQQKTEGLKITPSEGVWDIIEGQLPAEKKRKRPLLWLVVLLLLVGGAAWWLAAKDSADHTDKQVATSTDIRPVTNGKPTIAQDNNNTVASPYQPLPNTISKDAAMQSPSGDSTQRREQGNRNRRIAAKAHVHIGPSKAWANTDNGATDKQDNGKSFASPDGKTAGQVNTKILASDATMEPSIDTTADAVTLFKISTPITLLRTTIHPSTQQIQLAQRPFVALTVVSNNKDAKGSAKKNWSFGITAGIGASRRNDKLFSAGDEKKLQQMTAGGSITGVVFDSSKSSPINDYKAGLSFHVGMYAQRPMGNRWVLQTGLVYHYLSNRQPAGKEYMSFNNNSYVSLGNSAYKNRIHLVQIPVTLQYQLGNQRKWSLLMGSSLGYLAASNLLVYEANGVSPMYARGNGLYNRFQATAHIGTTVRPKQSTALALGLRVEYGITSLTKKTFDAQRMIAAQMFCQIPFSKK